MKIKFINIVLALLLFSSVASAQLFVSDVSKRGTTAAPFLTISQGARAAGMGSAFVAVSDDPSAIFWNVAGLARLKQYGFIFDHTQWFADLNYNFFAASIDLGDYGTLGASFISSDYGDMDVTSINEPEGTGESFTVNDMVFSLAWAINLTDNFSIGFNPKVIYQGIWKMSAFAFAMDMGVLYNTPFEGIVLGMSISNFGSKMALDGTSAVILYDPDETSSGNNNRIPAQLETEYWDLPLQFKVGVSYKALDSPKHKLLLAVDASHPNNDYESVNVGGEYVFSDIVSIRAGYKTLLLENSEESLTLGAGFKQRLMNNVSIRFDYAYSDFGRLGSIHKYSLSILF